MNIFKRSIKAKLITLVVAINLTLVFALDGSLIWHASGLLKAESHKRLSQTLDQSATKVNDFIAVTKSAHSQLAATPLLRAFMDNPSMSQVFKSPMRKFFTEIIDKEPWIADILLIRGQTVEYAHSGLLQFYLQANPDKSAWDLLFPNIGMNHRNVGVVEIHDNDSGQSKAYLVLSQAITKVAFKDLNHLVILIDVNSVNAHLFSQANVLYMLSLAVTLPNGKLFLTTPQHEPNSDRAHFVQTVGKFKEIGSIPGEADGMVFQTRAVLNLPMVIVGGASLALVLAPVNATVRISIIFGAVALLLSVLAAFWISNKIISPIYLLRNSAQKLAQGDLDTEIDVSRQDELGSLAQRFVDMRNSLKTHIADLKKAEEKYRGIFEHAVEGIFQSSPEGRLLTANPALAQMLGYDSSAEICCESTNISKMFYANPADRLRLVTELEEDEKVVNFEVDLKRRDGTVFAGLINARMIMQEEDKPWILEGTIQDITIQKDREKAIQEKIKAESETHAKSEFLAGMSHDLRTPLNAIMGFSEMMEQQTFGPLGDPHYEDYVKNIHKSGELLVSLINDILDLSKIEAGKFDLSEEDVDIAELVLNGVNMIMPFSESANINLQTDLPPDLPLLYGDQRAITQVLNNLLSNAVKFTPEWGTVTVSSIINDSGQMEVCVVDNGIGMSEQDIAKALEPFKQVDSTNSRKHVGTGLGLHLCQKLVEMHKGWLIVKSNIEKGTTVTVRFPQERTII